MTVYIVVEGQTEETFVKNCLGPYLVKFNIYIIPIIVSTKTLLSGLKTTGGLTNGNLKKFLSDINKILHSIPKNGLVTTLIDLYAIPTDFPGLSDLPNHLSSTEKANFLELALHKHFGNHNSFIPYIQMHEFEAFLFSHPDGFKKNIDPSKGDVNGLLKIIDEFENPELINSKKETSPSHRILKLFPTYKKNLLGNIIILDITIEQVLNKCPRFRQWIQNIIDRR